MNGFLFDENLPANLRFTPAFPVIHVSVLGKSPSDTQIWQYAKQSGLAIEVLIVNHKLIIVDFRINETLQIGRRCFQLRRFNPPRHLCGAVFNRTYRGVKVSIYFLNLL